MSFVFLLNIFIVQYNHNTKLYTFNAQTLRTWNRNNKFINRVSQSFILISQPFGWLKRSNVKCSIFHSVVSSTCFSALKSLFLRSDIVLNSFLKGLILLLILTLWISSWWFFSVVLFKLYVFELISPPFGLFVFQPVKSPTRDFHAVF